MDDARASVIGASRAGEHVRLPLINGSTSVRAARTTAWFARTVLLAAAVASCGKDAPRGTLAIGDIAPDYAAQALGGDSVSLAALRGRVVLLNVWATWCHPCRDEIPQLEALHQQYRARGLEIIGVTVDVSGMDDAIRSFMADFKMTYPVWLDPDERVSAQFRTIGVPETFLIDRTGVIRWRKIGPIQHGDSTLALALERALGG